MLNQTKMTFPISFKVILFWGFMLMIHPHTHTYSMRIYDVATMCPELYHKEEESIISTVRFSVMYYKCFHIKHNV